MNGHRRVGAGLEDLSISSAFIPTYLCVFLVLEAMTSAFKLFKCYMYLLYVSLYTNLTCNLLCYNNPFSVVVVSELTVLWIEKEVCRLEISGGQLLFSCGPEHFSNLVNTSKYPAV